MPHKIGWNIFNKEYKKMDYKMFNNNKIYWLIGLIQSIMYKNYRCAFGAVFLVRPAWAVTWR
jgi:hypothetical protein